MENTYYAKDGTLLAKGEVPEGYTAEGELYDTWQSEMQPFSAVVQSKSTDGKIVMCVTNKDVHYDLKNPLLRGIGMLVASHTEKGYDKVLFREAYIQEWAQRRTGLPLVLTAEADPAGLPETDTVFIQNEKALYDTFLEIPSEVTGFTHGNRMYRFEGTSGGLPCVVLAGMDWFAADLSYNFMQMPESVAKALDSAKERLNIDTGAMKETVANAKETLKGMTFSDYMHGGLLGKMRREKKEKTEQKTHTSGSFGAPAPSKSAPAEPEPVKKKSDLTIHGASRRYLCLCTADREKEAQTAFLQFIRSVRFDPSLSERESARIAQKMDGIRRQTAANQQLVLQKQAQLRQMQAHTSRMIADNARRASDGLMDSWQKKMDSDSRISQKYSEAIRGVDTYTNSYGQHTEVSAAADHVYENRYGDVYGVSGNALDQGTLNKLDWKELSKKTDN